jgi:membrane-associated phospholipid phosphatase
VRPGVASVPESPSLIPWGHLSGEYLASCLLLWKECIAYAISQVGSPPVLSSVGLVMTAVTIGTSRVWVLAVTYILLAIVTPLAYLFWLLHQGQVTDFDVQRREQRIRPMQFTLACGALAWLILAVAAAPRPLLLLTGALWVQMGIVFVITFWWKISVHCASAATLATIIGLWIGTPLPLMIGLPLIAWSRVHRRRHTPAQAIAGMCLGYLVALLALSLVE